MKTAPLWCGCSCGNSVTVSSTPKDAAEDIVRRFREDHIARLNHREVDKHEYDLIVARQRRAEETKRKGVR